MLGCTQKGLKKKTPQKVVHSSLRFDNLIARTTRSRELKFGTVILVILLGCTKKGFFKMSHEVESVFRVTHWNSGVVSWSYFPWVVALLYSCI